MRRQSPYVRPSPDGSTYAQNRPEKWGARSFALRSLYVLRQFSTDGGLAPYRSNRPVFAPGRARTVDVKSIGQIRPDPALASPAIAGRYRQRRRFTGRTCAKMRRTGRVARTARRTGCARARLRTGWNGTNWPPWLAMCAITSPIGSHCATYWPHGPPMVRAMASINACIVIPPIGSDSRDTNCPPTKIPGIFRDLRDRCAYPDSTAKTRRHPKTTPLGRVVSPPPADSRAIFRKSPEEKSKIFRRFSVSVL